MNFVWHKQHLAMRSYGENYMQNCVMMVISALGPVGQPRSSQYGGYELPLRAHLALVFDFGYHAPSRTNLRAPFFGCGQQRSRAGGSACGSSTRSSLSLRAPFCDDFPSCPVNRHEVPSHVIAIRLGSFSAPSLAWMGGRATAIL